MWADAVCINQKDLEERSHQVALMGDIYSGAGEIFIWLGNSISEADSSLRFSPGTLESGKDMSWVRKNIAQISEFSVFLTVKARYWQL